MKNNVSGGRCLFSIIFHMTNYQLTRKKSEEYGVVKNYVCEKLKKNEKKDPAWQMARGWTKMRR